MNKTTPEIKDYIFVGNVPAGADCSIRYPGIDCFKGKQAYDIHDNKLDKSYMLPLYVHKNSFDRYDRLMTGKSW